MKKRRRESNKSLLREIRTFKDPALKVVCKDVYFAAAKPVFYRMMKVLSATKTGIGLAANQIGETVRIIVIRPNKANMVVMINPIITFESEFKSVQIEGCLSYPGVFKDIERSTFIDVNYADEKGHYVNGLFENFEARIIQHEIDHLNGKCALS